MRPIKFGKYLLLERIAVGGMAEVFAAKAFGVEGFERLLAIKKILPTLGEDPEFVSMFVDEARIAVQLSHANIVQVLELGKHDESLYIAMEYVSGRDVRQLLDRFRRQGKPMPAPQACAIVAPVCEALDYAHRKRDASGKPLGIVHRDVSPQNVLVSFEGHVKLIDFGIAKAETRLQKTQAGILKGKFSYMSPEQVAGDAVDQRSDVFSAGVILWELLCGQKLFTGDSDFAVLEKVRKAEVPPPRTLNPELPEGLERVVLQALALEPGDRYEWCSELHDRLAPYTMVSGAMYGSRQLGEWIRDEYRAEHEKEQARLRLWQEPAAGQPPPPHAVRQRDPGAPAAASAERGVAAGPTPEQGWQLPADSDTLVQPPTPAGHDTQRSQRVRADTARTRLLPRGEASAPAFDKSRDLTGALRSERKGALIRPHRTHRALQRRIGIVAGPLVVIAVGALAYILRPASAPPPRIAVSSVASTEPVPAMQVDGVVLSAQPEQATPERLPPEQPAPKPVQKRRAAAPPKRSSVERAQAAPAVAVAQPQLAPPSGPSEPVVRGEPRLHIMTEPIGARIRVDGKLVGRAPLTTDPVEPGRDYHVTASLEGYVTVGRAVSAMDGMTHVTLALPLLPVAGAQPAQPPMEELPASAQIGYLVAATRPVARVTIDGRETGRWTPVPEANPIVLPAGPHTIVFETADGKRLEEKLEIAPGKTAHLVRELAQ